MISSPGMMSGGSLWRASPGSSHDCCSGTYYCCISSSGSRQDETEEVKMEVTVKL